MGVGVCVARTHKRKQPKKLHNFTIIFDVLLYVLRSCNMMRIYACIRRFHFAIAQKKKCYTTAHMCCHRKIFNITKKKEKWNENY